MRDEKVRLQPGSKLNPAGKGGFGEHPENRHDGRWSMEDSIPYWFNKFQRMALEEFNEWLTVHPTEITPAIKTAWQRVNEMMQGGKDALAPTDMVLDRTIGKPRMTVDNNVGVQDDNRLEITFKGKDSQ